MKGLVHAYRALTDIYLKGSWIGEAIKKQGAPLLENKGSYRLVYGVVEHEFLYEYRIARLVNKPPKSAVALLLKMGMYLLDCSDLPSHAAVNMIAETAKQVGKGGVTGFVNAILRRYATEGKTMLPDEEDRLLSVTANLPLWLVKRYKRELGDKAAARLTASRSVKTHIRPAFSFGMTALERVLTDRKIDFEKTAYGFYIGSVGEIADLIKEGNATVTSFGSAEIASVVPEGKDILDLCAAPGGKSVYLAEKFGARVVACDKYEHRVALIKKYAERMKVTTVEPVCADGRVPRRNWFAAFDTVLVDAPCSGLGSISSNPDVVLNRKERDLASIIETQKTLLSVAADYVKEGGALVYSTCSDLPSEDGEVVKDFLAAHPAFALEKQKYTDPHEGGGESYYYAILWKRNC